MFISPAATMLWGLLSSVGAVSANSPSAGANNDICSADWVAATDDPVALLQEKLLVNHRVMTMLQPDPDHTEEVDKKKKDHISPLESFSGGAGLNVELCVEFVIFFMVMRVNYPKVYSGNVQDGTAPVTVDVNRAWSWVEATWGAGLDTNIRTIGLDNAMLLEFTNFGIRMMALIGIPMFIITGALNFIWGGHAAGNDHFSVFSMLNVRVGSWLYWIHSIASWLIVILTCRLVYKAQERFAVLRWEWLKGLPAVRAHTVLVTGIPEKQQSDAELKHYFDILFPGSKVKSAYTVRNTTAMDDLLRKLRLAREGISDAEAEKKKDPKVNPTVRSWLCGGEVDAIAYHSKVISEVEPRINEIKKGIASSAKQPGDAGGNCHSGFVTFRDRHDAELAKNVRVVAKDADHFLIEPAPAPEDIDWRGLQVNVKKYWRKRAFGWALLVLLILAYIPLVVLVVNLGYLVHLPGIFEGMWESAAPTFGLAILLSFVPMAFMGLFRLTFGQKSKSWAQNTLQVWYFWFQVVFVFFVTTLAVFLLPNTDFIKENIHYPSVIQSLLANSPLYATPFYMSYLIVQCTLSCWALLRFQVLRRYQKWVDLYTEEEAQLRAEPEDQDYSGIGSRAARFTISMLIGLVFGTINPLVYLVCCLYFIVCRIVHGYLIPFAETKKPDLGGVIWVSQLRHLHVGLALYVAVMVIVLFQRSANMGPGLLLLPALIYISWAIRRFETAIAWERLPAYDLSSRQGNVPLKAGPTKEYTNPVLR